MPLISIHNDDPAFDGRQSEIALQVRSGTMICFEESEAVFIPEFTLPNGRRADLIGIDPKGLVSIVEIKSSIADFNSDGKWHEYLDYCDAFYFASHPDVPRHIFPEEEGFILADKFGGAILRPAVTRKLNAARRKALTLGIARAAARRLQQFTELL